MIAPKSVAKPPKGLDSEGRALWRSILRDVPDHLELDARELTVLGAACHQADQNAALATAIQRDGLTVTGAAGQRRLNACVTELRQGRTALARLLEAVDLGTAQGFSEAPASRRAKKAADARWRAA